MKNKLIVLLFIVILIFYTLTTAATNVYLKKTNLPSDEDCILDGAWLKVENGIKILYISGTNYEMGYQLGYLLKEPYMRDYRAYEYSCEHEMGIDKQDLLEAWNKNKEYVPDEYKEEMQGRADALNLNFEDVAVIETLNQFLFAFRKSCSGFAAWGPATKDGKLYHIRSHDCSLKSPFDPETKIPCYEHEHLVIRNPDNGYASISPTTILDVGVEGGFNEKGICVGYKASPCKDNSMYGTPSTIRQLMVLDHASTLKEATNIINSNTTIGLNYIISDSNEKVAVAVEQSANYSYIGNWDNPNESYSRYWSIQNVVRRGNCFINQDLASTQKGFWYNINSTISWLISPVFRQYCKLSGVIQNYWGKLDLNNSMKAIRAAYKYRYDPAYLFERLLGTTGVWDQWVACPETGDILVAFAQNGKNAFNSPTLQINLFDILQSEGDLD
jgi:hypothetical protein